MYDAARESKPLEVYGSLPNLCLANVPVDVAPRTCVVNQCPGKLVVEFPCYWESLARYRLKQTLMLPGTPVVPPRREILLIFVLHTDNKTLRN